jgi:hypothetical protein
MAWACARFARSFLTELLYHFTTWDNLASSQCQEPMGGKAQRRPFGFGRYARRLRFSCHWFSCQEVKSQK